MSGRCRVDASEDYSNLATRLQWRDVWFCLHVMICLQATTRERRRRCEVKCEFSCTRSINHALHIMHCFRVSAKVLGGEAGTFVIDKKDVLRVHHLRSYLQCRISEPRTRRLFKVIAVDYLPHAPARSNTIDRQSVSQNVIHTDPVLCHRVS